MKNLFRNIQMEYVLVTLLIIAWIAPVTIISHMRTKWQKRAFATLVLYKSCSERNNETPEYIP